METRPPTVGRILIAVGFAISCFALALFLWLTFGGAIPLKPEGYRFTVPRTQRRERIRGRHRRPFFFAPSRRDLCTRFQP